MRKVIAMQTNRKMIIGRMAMRLSAFPVGYHLSPENFSRSCRLENPEDVWSESLDLSRDRSDLYSDSVIKNAFAEFLYPVVYRRPEEFPAMFVRVLTGFFPDISRPLPPENLKKRFTRPWLPGCIPGEDIFRHECRGRGPEEVRSDRANYLTGRRAITNNLQEITNNQRGT